MCTGEWVDAKLSEVIESYPEMMDWDLVIWDDCTDDAELYNIGSVKKFFEEYKDQYVSYTDADYEHVQLEGDMVSLGMYDPEWWEY